jgi:hypothetical protein
VNFWYFAKDILRKTWENLHLNCETLFSSKKLPHVQNKKIGQKRGIFQITIPLTRLQIHLHCCMKKQMSDNWKRITKHETNILPQLHTTCNNNTFSSC